jgi:hypothetical protein
MIGSTAIAWLLISRSFWVAPAGESKISFDTPGERVSELLKDWSSRYDMPLAATKATASQVVAIHLTDVSEKEALAKLAQVLHASWQQDKTQWYLVRSGAQDRIDREAEHRLIVAKMKSAQDRIAKSLAALGEFNPAASDKLASEVSAYAAQAKAGPMDFEQFQKANDLQARTPFGRCAIAVRLTVSPEEIADLPIGIRVVYSTSPNHLQRKLPDAAIGILQREIADQQVLVQSASRTPANPGEDVYLPAADNEKPYSDPPVKALLAVTRQQYTRAPLYELLLIAANGKVVAQSNRGVFTQESGDPVPVETRPDLPIDLSDDAKGYMKLLHAGPRVHEAPTPIQLEQLSNPQKYEPLGLVAGPILQGLAKARNENLVAWLPDSHFTVASLLSTMNLTTNQVIAYYQRNSNLKEKDGWLTVEPLLPATERDVTADRGVLTRFLSERASHVPLTIEHAADWAVQLPSDDLNPLPRVLEQVVSGTGEFTSMGRNLLHFYGEMSPDQRATAVAPQGLALGSLNEAATNDLDRMLFGFASTLQLDPRNPARRSSGPLFGIEPTEALANVSLGELRLRINEQNQSSVQAVGANGPVVMSPFTLASIIAGVNPGFGQFTSVPTKFYAAPRRTLQFQIDLGEPLLPYRMSVSQTNKASETVMSFDELPQEFKDQVNRLVQMIKNGNLRVGGGGLRGGGTPSSP